jgi:hypothetical protein
MAQDGDPCADSPTQLTTRATQMAATAAPALRAEAILCVDAKTRLRGSLCMKQDASAQTVSHFVLFIGSQASICK